MDVVGIKDIATLFASRAKLGDIEAEAFVNSMFSVIRQGLEADRQIKIRGFGTFKIIDVEPRESVNVNTGERFVIDSHRKVTFTPDATMKELVNKPFSLFNTVALNDGVEFDDAETENPAEIDAQEVEADMQGVEVQTEVQTEAEGQETVEQKPENSEGLTDETPQTGTETAVESSEETAVADDEAQEETDKEPQNVAADNVPEDMGNVPETAESVSEVAESIPEDMESVSEDIGNVPEGMESVPEVEESVPEATGISEDNTDAPDDAGNATDCTTEVSAVETEPIAEGNKTHEASTPGRGHKALAITLYCLLTLVLMAASAYAGMLYGRLHANDDCALPCGASAETAPATVVAASEETTQPNQQADNVKPAQPDTLAKDMSDVQEKDVAKEKPQTDGNNEPADKGDKPSDKDNRPADKNPKNKDNEAAAMMQTATRYADKDVRVRTGAYCIVGTARTVTVSQGETLASISRRELGPGMDCYLETFNDLSSNAVLKAGQTVRIPKLMLRKTLRKMTK